MERKGARRGRGSFFCVGTNTKNRPSTKDKRCVWRRIWRGKTMNKNRWLGERQGRKKSSRKWRDFAVKEKK